MSRTVVVTGGSAGIGRAVAELLGARGDRVGILARGRAGLEGAAEAIRGAGGQSLAIATDVADYDQVKGAAARIEGELGPIDIWINVAFASVFAPFWEISPEEFKRVTEVSYLGFVYGSRVALDLMRPRGRGTIVQVGSALGTRSIPLQSAYCGAKHAINGFTSSLRTELMHEQSRIRVTVVQMPAVNTPQFSWVLCRLPNHPQPVPPIFQPEVAARGVLYAADHPQRKQYWVGGSTAAAILADKVAAPLLDRYLARSGYASQQTNQSVAPERPHNLWTPVDGGGDRDFGAHGVFDARARDWSVQMWASHHAKAVTALGAAVGVAGMLTAKVLARRWGNTRAETLAGRM